MKIIKIVLMVPSFLSSVPSPHSFFPGTALIKKKIIIDLVKKTTTLAVFLLLAI
jgi:hypothetical protein